MAVCSHQCNTELLAINSYDSPPYPMFGGGRNTLNKSNSSEIAAAFTTFAGRGSFYRQQVLPQAKVQALLQLASPGRIADLRAKYIQQIEQLHSLSPVR